MYGYLIRRRLFIREGFENFQYRTLRGGEKGKVEERRMWNGRGKEKSGVEGREEERRGGSS